MNYNIPYYGFVPASRAFNVAAAPLKSTSGGIFSKLFRGFNFGSILKNAQKTLNVVNQTIPLIKEVNPIIKNAKTMFRVMNEFKKVDSDTIKSTSSSTTTANKQSTTIPNKTEVSKSVNNNVTNTGGPTFFVN